MATVQQTITLTVMVVDPGLAVSPVTGVATVPITISPTSQRFPPYYDVLTIDAVNLKYMRRGAEIGDVNPLILAGADGKDIPGLVIADVATMTAAGVFNL